MTTQAAPASPLAAVPSPSLRLLALVLTALLRVGLQHVAVPRREGEDGQAVVVDLLCNAKRHFEVLNLMAVVSSALRPFGLQVNGIPLRALTLAVSAVSPDALLQVPSVEGVGAALQGALRAKMEAAGCPEATTIRVQGIGSQVYVTGGGDDGEGAANAKATRWCKRWLAKHFPEFIAEEGRDPVSGLAVTWVEHHLVRRALRLTVAPVASVAADATRAA
jgi:hypothetical protein